VRSVRASGAWAYLAGFLTLAGLIHFIAPQFYRPLIPEPLGDPDPWVYGSGVAEILVGVALIPKKTRRPAALSAAALFVLVFPGNLQMAWDARDDTTLRQVATIARLPIQAVLIWWALRVANAARPRPSTSAPASAT
jgi:uncharacterized membrane protein